MPSSSRYIVKDSHPVLKQWAKKEFSEKKKKKNSTTATSSTNKTNRNSMVDSGGGGGGSNNKENDSSTPFDDNNNDDGIIQGRRYTIQYARLDGGIKATEVLYGIQMACLSIVDDEPDTLKKVSKMNPWQLEAMKMIVNNNNNNNIGNNSIKRNATVRRGQKTTIAADPVGVEDEECYKPLSFLLKDHFDLTLDHHIDVSGVTIAGHVLDTQGFIAHNETTIVLSYRCTTSAFDWLTNLTTTSSAWEIDEDVAQGHSGFWSSCAGYDQCLCSPFGGTNGCDITGNADTTADPRVHTGFYNNFLVTVPIIRKYIDPLLASDQPPRTLYVVGHSLGAGIATLAGCYFLLEKESYGWGTTIPHKLRIVTAGGPRSCCKSMQYVIDERLEELRSLSPNTALFLRVVRDRDGVVNVPPRILGFEHPTKTFVFLSKEDSSNNSKRSTVFINPDLTMTIPKNVMRTLLKQHPGILPKGMNRKSANSNRDDDSTDSENEDFTTLMSSKKGMKGGTSNNNTTSNDNKNNANKLYHSDDYKMIPRPLRDHMPQFYLKPLYDQVQQDKEEEEREKKAGLRGKMGVGFGHGHHHDNVLRKARERFLQVFWGGPVS